MSYNSQVISNDIKIKVDERVVIAEDLRGFLVQLKFNLKEAVMASLEQALTEILYPVIQRSVAISLITTKEICLKDHCVDGDPGNFMASVARTI